MMRALCFVFDCFVVTRALSVLCLIVTLVMRALFVSFLTVTLVVRVLSFCV